jgi:exodeoxyribonuclease III
MDKLNFCTLNVHGLRNNRKRKSLFYKFKQNNFDIICLQETYILNEDFEKWKKEWGGELYFCENTNHSKGQVILVKKGLPFKTQCIVKMQRILIIEITLHNTQLYVINLYGPNESNERLAFFNQVKTEIRKLPQGERICLGDANTVLDNDLDIVSGEKHNDRDVENFQTILTENNMSDVWRLAHGENKEYTWSKSSTINGVKRYIARRLDYILVNDNMLEKCFDCTISSIAQSDHRMVCMKFRLTTIPRGPSYYKFNDSLLHDQVFVNKMNNFITEFETEYQTLNAQCKWDLCKLKMKELSMAYSKEKCMLHRQKMTSLNKKLDELDSKLAVDPQNDILLQEKQKIKQEVELDEMNKAKSAQIRAREKFITDGEKNTRYFLNLEKVRGSNKIIENLKTTQGNITSQTDILAEQVSFFKDGFTNKTQFDQHKAEMFTAQLDIPQLSQNHKDQIDSNLIELPEDEILAALKSLNNSSAPGLSGLTTSFIKFFWSKLKGMLVNSLRSAYSKGEMSISQKKAVITLIYKEKGLPRDELKNYRPISILEIDYKILAKLLAFRLAKVIQTLVNEDQVGFIKNRQSSTIIRLIDDVIEYLKEENKPGILLALDYSRAFDSISKEFMIWSFKKFGFGDNFIKWVEVLTKNTESCINYNGWISETFAIETGIRQGCPFSPMAFVLALELLAIKIRADDTIKGIKLPKFTNNNNELECIVKLALYADDITMFLRDQHALEAAINIVNSFAEFSQLQINTVKTEAMWLGSMRNSRQTYLNLNWKTQVKILGIIFRNGTSASNIEENWQNRINKMKAIIINWSKRNLSISGKICIIKTYLISQVIYPLQALAAPHHFLNTINTMLFRFLWKKKYSNTKAFEKVKRTVMCSTASEGGLGMINIIDMQSSFLIAWIAKLQDEPHQKWKNIPRYRLNKLGDNLACLRASVTSKNIKGTENICSGFWEKALISWNDNKSLFLNNEAENLNQPLWNNINIMYRHKNLYLKRWIEAKISWLKDVWQNDSFVTIDNITAKTGYYPALQFEYNAVKTAVMALINQRNNPLPFNQNNYTQNTAKTAQQYRKLITKSKTPQPTSTFFWQHRFNYSLDDNNWLLALRSTKEERLRLLQWKILHNIYPTNILLQKMGIKDNNLCETCGDIDYLEHFFWGCPKMRQFWKYVEQIIIRKTGINVKITEEIVLFGYNINECKKEINKTINHMLLIGKMTISKFRYGDGYDINYIFDHETSIRLK